MPPDIPPQILPDLRLPKILIGDTSGFDGTADGPFLRGDVILTQGRVTGMTRAAPTATGGDILLPELVEAHCHLDKCHTIDRLGPVGGDLAVAMDAQRADKSRWTAADLRARAAHGLRELATAGTGSVRTHVDWSDTSAPPLAWSVLRDLAIDSPLALQLCALTGAAQMADPTFARTVARTVAQTITPAFPSGHALGVFARNQPDMATGLRHAFDCAARYGLALDFHVDEGEDPALNGLETIADIALETTHQGPILCGHAVSLASRAAPDVARITDKLARAGISVAILPSTNLYLQGRTTSDPSGTTATPTRRGLTLAQELVRAGVSLVIGTDNVRDAFCPVGRHDPRRALELAILAAHLDPPLDRWLPAITTDAAAAIGLPPPFLRNAPRHSLLIAEAGDLSTLICGAPLRPVPSSPTASLNETRK